MPIEFAPLLIPLERRLQTLSVGLHLLSVLLLPFIGTLLFLYLLLFTRYAILMIIYVLWIVFFDRHTPKRGGRRRNWLSKLRMWHYYRRYFPISLVKVADLDPSRRYLIGYHPHGIIGMGVFPSFASDASDFAVLYPGIRPHILTLASNFYYPFAREYILSYGTCDCSRESINYLLSEQSPPGTAAVIAVGGAQEALDAGKATYRLTLLHRKGFIRLAIKNGASLVPCFSFGEKDLFHQAENPRGSYLRRFQEFVKACTGYSPAVFYGRGIFNYTFGFMPYRVPIVTVIGEPIHLSGPKATYIEEEVNALHSKYLHQLEELFDQHKGKYGISEEIKLEFV